MWNDHSKWMHSIINECSPSTEGSHFCFAPALCEWRKRAKRRMRSLSCMLLGREERCCQTSPVVLQGQMAAQPVISHLWTVLAVAILPLAPHFSCSHSSLCGYCLILIYSLPIRGLTTAISLLTHCSPTQDVNNLLIFTQQGDLRFAHKLSR